MKAGIIGAMGVAVVLVLGGCDAQIGGEVDDAVDPNEPDPWAEVSATAGEPDTSRETSSCKQHSGIANGDYTQLSYESVARLAHNAGISCSHNLVNAVAVAAAESGRRTHAFLVNKSCSIDRGLWQINSYYHPSYSSFDTALNAKGMVQISSHGKSWSAWVAYQRGMHHAYLASACAAVKKVCGQSYC